MMKFEGIHSHLWKVIYKSKPKHLNQVLILTKWDSGMQALMRLEDSCTYANGHIDLTDPESTAMHCCLNFF